MRLQFAALLLVLLPASGLAQETHSHKLIPHAREALLLATVGSLMPFDARISHAFDGASLQDNHALHSTASAFNALGDPGTVIIAVAALGTGIIAGSDNLTDFGLQGGEAIALSGTVTFLIKGMAGRLRPNKSPGDADEFKLAGGFSGEGGQSFPSGHTTAAFALATTLSEEVKLHDPALARYVTPASYAAAALVGLARIYSQKHWASDVVLGGAIGVYSAKYVFKHGIHAKKPGKTEEQ